MATAKTVAVAVASTIQEVLQIKAQGDAAAGAQDWDTAKQCYQQVLAALDNGVAADAGVSAREEELPVFFEAKIHSNLALVHLKLQELDQAQQSAQTATELAPEWAKGFARLAMAQEASGRLIDAERSYLVALDTLQPQLHDCHRELAKLTRTHRFKCLKLVTDSETTMDYENQNQQQQQDPYTAISAMTATQRTIFLLLVSGRVLSRNTNPVATDDLVAQQDILLELMAIDSSTLLLLAAGQLVPAQLVCPGTQSYLLQGGNDNMRP